MKKAVIAKCLGVLLAVNILACSAEAARINTVIDTTSGMYGDPESVYNEIDYTVKSWFFPSEEEMKKMTFSQRTALENGNQHVLVPFSESDAIVQIYREEKAAAIIRGQAVSDLQPFTGMQVLDTTINKEDLVKLSPRLGADYILYFKVTNNVPAYISDSQKVNVTTDFRVWDAKIGDYVFAKRYVTAGFARTRHYGLGSPSDAIRSGLIQALDQIDKDKIIALLK